MRTKIHLIMSVCLLFVLSGCNNWLDVELDNKVEDSKLFSTPEGFKEALAGVYSNMSKDAMYGQVLSMEYLDILGQYYSYTGIKNTYEDWKDFDYESSSSEGVVSRIWNNFYSNISQLNCILKYADENASVLNEADRNQVRGEALALRAYLHFDLYRLFSSDVKRSPKAEGIPYNKVFGVSIPPMYTAEESVQLVIDDLLEAEKCLANDPIVNVVPYDIKSESDKGLVVDAAAKDKADKYVARMNLYGVKALLARVYQARGQNEMAIQKAKEVIESGKFRLLEFSSIDQSELEADILFTDEHIFSLRNKELNTYSKKLHYDISLGSGATQMMALPFAETHALYEGNNDDARYSKWFNTGKFVKFVPDSTNIYTQKMPMIKLSEMYLIVAECSYNTDATVSLEYINTLRDHRIRNNVDWQYLTKESILQECRREFVGEGQMWYVYKRNHWDLPGNGTAEKIEASDDIFVFPLPDAEIEDGHRSER